MNPKTREITGIITVIILILIPFGWILLSQEPAGPFTRNTSIDEIRDIMTQAGIILCSEHENTWNIPGALGGMTYTVMEDCSLVNKRPDTTIHVQEFSNEEARNAAVHGFNAQSRGKPNGVFLTHGPYVILVQGRLHESVAELIKKEIEKW